MNLFFPFLIKFNKNYTHYYIIGNYIELDPNH